MDTTKTTTHLGLCAGYGGIEIGLKRVIPNLRSVALCEIEAFACANLVAKMEAGLLEPAPIWTDLKTFPWDSFRHRVDILTGGYPCQPFSSAGKRLGTDDPRHLWPYIADGIRILRPKLCFFENVEGHISLGLREVIGELESIGYQTAWGIFSASEVGAPHQRKRVFILAYNQRQRVEELGRQIAVGSKLNTAGDDGSDAWPSRPGEPQHGWEPPRVVGGKLGDSPHQRDIHQTQQDNTEAGADFDRTGEGERMANTSIVRCDGRPNGISGRIGQPSEVSEDVAGCGCEGNGLRQTEPSLGRDADGPAGGLGYAELCVSCDNRTDELRLLGNGVVPATATSAFLVLMDQLLNENL